MRTITLAKYKAAIFICLLSVASVTLRAQGNGALSYKAQPNIVNDTTLSLNFADGVLFVEPQGIPFTVKIYDITGKPVAEKKQTGPVIDITMLKRGFYIIQVTCGEKTVTRKFVVK